MKAGITGTGALILLVFAVFPNLGSANDVVSGYGLSCISSLDLIRKFEDLVEDESAFRTYVLVRSWLGPRMPSSIVLSVSYVVVLPLLLTG